MGRTIKQIIIHCSATRPEQDIGAAELKRMHVDPKPRGRGWKDIGYHYVIRRNGKIELGRDLDGDGLVDEHVGAHAFGWNSNSLSVVLIGGANKAGHGEANFTKEQMIALDAFLVCKQQEYPNAEIMGHRDTGANKDCPSFNVAEWMRTGKLTQPRKPLS